MIVVRKRKNETVETKFSPNCKQLIRIEGDKTYVYSLADEVTFRSGAKLAGTTITVTPANRTWNFGFGGTATIRG